MRDASALQQDLTKPRKVFVKVMLPTTADGIRFEGAEQLLKVSAFSKKRAPEPNDVRQALAIYQAHLNSSSQLGSYAAHIGAGICYMMLNDLENAWALAGRAGTIVPKGEQHKPLIEALAEYELETQQRASNSLAPPPHTGRETINIDKYLDKLF